jgi:hypothetical protein
MFKVLELAANKALETTHFNIQGKSIYNTIKFNPQAIHTKKVREFFSKNQIIKTFLHGLDKRDERVFLNDVKASGFSAGDRVIRINSKDRALYFVVQGSFFAVDDSYPNRAPTYKPGAVLGID